MADFVRLGDSVADLLAAAQRIKATGEQVTSAMQTAVDAINALDTPATFRRDDFTDAFLHGDGKGYHQPVESGVSAGEVPANEAVKLNALQLGPGMTALGERALDKLREFVTVDETNRDDILKITGH